MKANISRPFKIRPLSETDRDQVAEFIRHHWAGETVVVHGVTYHPAALPGFVAITAEEWLGLVTYHIENDQCELVTLNSLQPEQGIAAALLRQVIRRAREAGCSLLHLTTTNDNTNPLRFYQKHGFRITAIHRDAVAASRKLKPTIPSAGESGIPILDEIVLELGLDQGR
jgi:GNAT superfamily N-acetyltransferase